MKTDIELLTLLKESAITSAKNRELFGLCQENIALKRKGIISSTEFNRLGELICLLRPQVTMVGYFWPRCELEPRLTAINSLIARIN